MCWNKEEWPIGKEFNRYVPFFLRQPPNPTTCAKTGLGQFDDGVRYYYMGDSSNDIEITSNNFQIMF